MHTVLLVSKSIPLCTEVVVGKLDSEITHVTLNKEVVDDLLDDYSSLIKLSNSSFAGTMKTHQEISVQVLRPDINHLQDVVRKRQQVFQEGGPEEIFTALKKYGNIFSKSIREIQDFHYEVPKPFASYDANDLKKMLWIKMSDSYEYPLKNDIFKVKLHFVWHPEVEEYQLMRKIPGLTALNSVPFETYAISLKDAHKGILCVELDSQNFFSMEMHIPVLRSGMVTIRKKTLFASRMIDPRAEFFSKDAKFVKSILRQAMKKMDQAFKAYNLWYEDLRCA